MFTIRLLEEADAPEFVRLRLEGLQNDPAAFGSSWEEEQARPLETVAPRLRALPESHFVVGAFQGERLIGVTGFRREEQRKARHKGFVWGVYVTAEARGKGVARALLTFVQERARTYSGLDQLFLSVSVSQTAARHLYDSLGFEVFGYERHALKIGDTYVDEEHRVCWLIPPPTRGS